jgi:hypothetical protein
VDFATSGSATPLLRRNPDGRVEMRCPKCEEWADILAYKMPDVVEKYADHLNVIVKCINCKHVCSPRWLNED